MREWEEVPAEALGERLFRVGRRVELLELLVERVEVVIVVFVDVDCHGGAGAGGGGFSGGGVGVGGLCRRLRCGRGGREPANAAGGCGGGARWQSALKVKAGAGDERQRGGRARRFGCGGSSGGWWGRRHSSCDNAAEPTWRARD